MKNKLLFIFYCLLISAPLFSLQAKTIQEKDFYPHKITTKTFNETWSYQFVFDNGTKAFVNITTLHLPTQGRKIGCDISFFNFKGKNYSVGRQYPEERLKAQKDRKRITVKDEYFLENLPGKGHRVYFSAHKNGDFLLDLTFETAKKSVKPDNEIIKLEDETYSQILHIPYGRVSGVIAYNKDTIQVRGYGVFDQSYQSSQATDLAKRVISFSKNSSQNPFFAKIGIAHSGKPFGYGIFLEGETPRIRFIKKIEVDSKEYSGKNFPKGQMNFIFDDGFSVSFSVAKTQQKFSLLDNFDGWFAQKGAKILMGGEPLFYRGHTKDKDGKFIDWSIMGL